MRRLFEFLILSFILSLIVLAFTAPTFAQTPISYGQTVSGAISAAGEKDEFTFSGTNGDVITIRFAKTNGNLSPYVELFDPGSTRIAYSTSGVINATLAAAGTFKITLRDNNNTNIGDYSLSLQRLNNPGGAIALNFGQTASGTIDSFAKMVTYQFSANANDKILIAFAGLTQTSGTFDLYLELYDTTGTKLVDSSSGVLTATTTTAGNLYLLVMDRYRNGTGTYELTLQRTNNPANAQALSFGQTTSGTIATFTDIDVYSFTASINDTITVRFAGVSTTSGTFDPYLGLYDATGTSLTTSSSGSLTQKVTASGTFYLLATDNSRNGTGTYSLSLQRLNNPGGAIALNFGQTASGTIDSFAKIVTYQFSANANDKILIAFAGLTQTSGTFDLYLELYDTTGTKLVDSSSGVLTATTTTAGNLYLLVMDRYRNGTGTYSLSLQRLNNPGNATALNFGQTASGTIDSFAKIVTYQFSANANDKILIAFAGLTQTSGTFDLYLELYDTTGTKLVDSSSGVLTATTTTAGNLYLLVMDRYRNGTGAHELTLQRTNNPANVKNLNYNSLTEDSLEVVTGINVYSFTANANDIITICSSVKTTTSGTFTTYLELYDTTGNRLTYSSGSLKYTFTSGGTFYLFVTDSSRNGTGIYRLKLLNGDISCSSIDFVEPQVSLINPKAGEIIESGSTYTISWTSSDNVGITSQEIRLSTDSDLTYPTIIASGLASSVQSYDWQVPQDLSTAKGRIKIICADAAANIGQDESSSDFSVIKTTLPPDAKDIGYEYDKLNRLTRSVSEAGSENNYSYDALGNRLTLTVQVNVPADFDHDGDVDWADLAVFMASWLTQRGQPGYNPACDFNDDGIVNFRDYTVFANEWNPRPPSNLSAQAVSPTQITLSWQDNTDGESGFKLERKLSAEGAYGQIATVGQNMTGYSDSGLAVEQTYYYRVCAYGATFAPSGYSNEANASTEPKQPPVLDPIGNRTVNEGQLLQFSISATDPDKDMLTYSAQNLPAGAAFTGQTFTWTPTSEQAGTYPVTFSVSDGELNDSETINIEVYGKPLMTFIFPRSGAPGSYLRILGKDFGSRNSSSRVQFSSLGGSKQTQKYAQLILWNKTYIICRVPEIKPGIYRVTVINQAGKSNPNFFIVRPKMKLP